MIDEDGDTINDEKIVKARIEMFWGDLFCINGDAIHDRKKETVDDVMRNSVGYICEKDLRRAIKLLKENKATNESGMIAEYIKALEEDVLELCVGWRMHSKVMEGDKSSTGAQGWK